ncbi:hypothetical protein NDU88_006266 [Pleurodeles waltl]|uniref:Uncharacterized protein n=1 Tax=Pleurodeles waltl TaxID=8319 RepID=A0AAV7VQ08_PLEWA|nr:hypothetical protein NDU88_006266 [Pleurodeles waltl]
MLPVWCYDEEFTQNILFFKPARRDYEERRDQITPDPASTEVEGDMLLPALKGSSEEDQGPSISEEGLQNLKQKPTNHSTVNL